MSFSGSVVLVKKIFKYDPTPFLHFCSYLPFEENLALNLNNLEFSLPKDILYQVGNWLSGCGDEIKKKSSVFLLFRYYRITGYFSGNLILALLTAVLVTLKIINANKTFKISIN
jgi:hypothetical protein